MKKRNRYVSLGMLCILIALVLGLKISFDNFFIPKYLIIIQNWKEIIVFIIIIIIGILLFKKGVGE